MTCKKRNSFWVSFTSTGLLVQELVACRALALEADGSVHADVGAAAVVDHAFVQS